MTTTRPLPTLETVDLATWVPESDSPVWEQFTVYTSANVGEDLPRVITPLTSDIQRWIIGHGFFNLQRNLGTLGPLGLDFNDFHHAGIGVFYGRAHLTLGFIRAFADLLPGTDADAVDEQYLGKKRAPDQPPKEKSLDQVLFSLTAYPRFMRILKQAPTLTMENDPRVNEYIHREIALDLTAFDLAGLWAKVLESIQWQEYAFDLHMYNNPAISSAMEQLTQFLKANVPDAHDGVLPTLLTGMGTVESAKPGMEIWRLGRLAVADAAVRAIVAAEPTDRIGAALARSQAPGVQAFVAEVRQFLHDYGYRTINEMEFEQPRWADDPSYVYAAIKNYLDARPDHDPALTVERQAKARAEMTAWVEARLSEPQRLEFRGILGLAQAFGSLRERTKSQWIRCIWPCRRFINALAARLEAGGVLRQADDVFFLRLEELRTLAAGGTVEAMQEHIDLRRAENAIFQQLELPEWFDGRPTPRVKGSAAPEQQGNVLHGIPVSPGIVTAKARVVLQPDDDAEIEDGEVLVCPVTDAAWGPLFFSASALVVDLGGPLSHGSQVAREYGIPAVVNVKTGTRTIKTGQTITVDGAAGTVTLGE